MAPQPAGAPSQTIIHGDSLTVMRSLPDASVDAIVTSPPYNVGVKCGTCNDNLPRADYLTWMAEHATEFARLLREDGAVFLNLGTSAKDPWLADDVIRLFRPHFTRQNDVTWVKSIEIRGETSGQFLPINSDRLLNRTNEQIYHLSRTGRVPIDRLAIGVPYQDKSNLGRWYHATADRRCGGNSWFIPYEPICGAKGKHGHPAIFPLELPRRCLKLHGKSGGLVLDPFAGSGTTLVAARQLGWRGIGIEIDETYAETARRRIAEVERA
ncbi:hypothetical protein IT41_19370 [Paracoccus halophilus]|uniref:Methyltransferase n=1 Tax=Paracoccus halophilus TaxID=376733 RepID=A0A099EUQ8_9RHOB|nr:hypothetical protein IT41_19370 [Paracoccus halophilus]